MLPRERKRGRTIASCEALIFSYVSFVFLFIMSLALPSCGTERKVSDSSIDNDLRREIETIVDGLMDRRVVEIKTSDLITDITIKEREFDTDKPIDKETGERPVKKVTDTTINITRNDSTVVSDSTYVKNNMVINVNQDDSIKESVETKVEDKESRWPVVFICLSVLAGMLAIIFVLRKSGIINNIKSFDELINFLGNKWRRKWGNHIDKLMR